MQLIAASARMFTVSGTSNGLASASGALVRAHAYDAPATPSPPADHAHLLNNGRMKTANLGAASGF